MRDLADYANSYLVMIAEQAMLSDEVYVDYTNDWQNFLDSMTEYELERFYDIWEESCN